jgi:hypothetical protein
VVADEPGDTGIHDKMGGTLLPSDLGYILGSAFGIGFKEGWRSIGASEIRGAEVPAFTTCMCIYWAGKGKDPRLTGVGL